MIPFQIDNCTGVPFNYDGQLDTRLSELNAVPQTMFTLLTHRLRFLFATALGLFCSFGFADIACADNPPSSITYTEIYRDTIRNDPDFGPFVIPIVSSSLSVTLYTNVPSATFSAKTPWDITFGLLEISGSFSNDPNYTVGKTSAAFPFVDPNTSQVAGAIFMSWQSDHFMLTIRTSSDFVDALDFYTGATQPISDASDLTITVGKLAHTSTIFLSGHNTHRIDPVSQLDLDTGNILGKGDFIGPTVSIQSPAPNFATFNSALNVTGLATDNIGVGAVMWRWAVPGEDPSRGASRFDDWSSVDVLNIPETGLATRATWSTAVDMSFNEPGTNRFWVTSQDPAGHFSAIQTRQFFYSVPSYLTLQSTDGGRPVGGPGVFNNAALIINRPYSVNAIANRDSIFLNWIDGDGTVVSITPQYKFLMQDSLTLQANFGPNPFPAVAGVYNGLFNPATGVSELDSGLISVTVSSHGTYSGHVTLESGTYSFTGQFGFYGNAGDPNAADTTFQITAKGLKPILGSLHIAGAGPNALSRNLTGQLSVFDARLQKRVVSVIDAGYSAGAIGDVAAGLYNFQLPSSQGTTQIGPLGYGYGSVTLKSNALATTMVTLADQTPVATCSSALVEGGSLPVFISGYGGLGIMIGWLTFTNEATSDLRGDNVHWIKRRRPANAFYPDGFHRIFEVTGCRYVAPKAGTNILGWTSGTVSFADFAFSGTEGIAFDPKLNRFSFPANQDNFRIGFSPATGIFTGTFASRPSLPLRGIVLPKLNTAYGFFLDQNQSGFVVFSTP